MVFKQAIAGLFNVTAYIAILIGIFFLLSGIYAAAAILIVGGWVLDQCYLKRWCLGFHHELREDVSIQTVDTQKAEVSDITDIKWTKMDK